MFDDNFIAGLPDHPLEGLKAICDFFITFHQTYGTAATTIHYEKYLEAYALLSSYIEAYHLDYKMPGLTNRRVDNINNIFNSFTSIRADVDTKISSNTVEILKSRYQAKFKDVFAYEFSEGDLKQIQKLINELRSLITESNKFDGNHKGRLLKRLEKLQAELHKRISDLDKFWGLIGDAGVVIGKFGIDAKPVVDRIREIADIVWRTQARAEELPSGTDPFSVIVPL